MSGFAKAKQGQLDKENPWLVWRSSVKNVEVWALKWSDLIEENRRKLTYLGNVLHTKDREVREQWEREFPDVDLQKLRSVLSLTKRKG